MSGRIRDGVYQVDYYNGYDVGTYTDDLMDLFEYGTQKQIRLFFRSILQFCDDRLDIAAELIGDIIDKLSELRTLLDVMKSCSSTTKSDISRTQTKIKRLELAERLCKEV